MIIEADGKKYKMVNFRFPKVDEHYLRVGGDGINDPVFNISICCQGETHLIEKIILQEIP